LLSNGLVAPADSGTRDSWLLNQRAYPKGHQMLSNTRQLLTVAVALLIPFGADANDIPPDFEFQNVHRTTAEIVIDGDLSEWRFAAPIIDPLIGIPKIGQGGRVEGDPPSDFVIHEEYNGGTWEGIEDQSSVTELVWDADGLYIGTIVTDDYHENAANSPWNGDALQLMITTDDRESDFALYNYSLGGVEEDLVDDPLPFGDYVVQHERGFSGFDSDQELISDIAIVRDTRAQRTYYEMFVPVGALGLEAEEMVEGTQLGLAMTVNDGDADAPGQRGWIGLGAHAIVFGKTPSEAALLTLAAPIDPGAVAGDFNGDGVVDLADFEILTSNFNQPGDATTGDMNFSRTVDLADFNLFREAFSESGAGAAASVPEPSAMLLGLLGAAFVGSVCRRSR
jgi:hypothetical protein